MGSFLKMVKGFGKALWSLDTGTKLKIVSGVAVLVGGIAIASGALEDTDVDPLVIDGKTAEALPGTDPSPEEVIEVENPEIIDE